MSVSVRWLVRALLWIGVLLWVLGVWLVGGMFVRLRLMSLRCCFVGLRCCVLS